MIIGNTIRVSAILMMFSVWLGTSLRRIVVALQHYETVLRGVAANFVVSPLIIYLVLFALPLPAGIKIGIMLMAAAPVAPMAPQFVDGARGT
jgi:predicted Na+-dependent transporter